MTDKQTPGPWEWSGVWLDGQGDHFIVRSLVGTKPSDKTLIAAAPDMLWLLHKLVEQEWFQGSARMQDLVAEVVAKAEGKADD
jgi:hypothetical protein